jgi:hypothetical protein
MAWQDIVISIAQLSFIFALLPSIRSKDKPATATSIMNAVLIFTIATCLLTLKLWFSAASAYIVTIAWVILAVQKIKLNRERLP